MKKEVPVPALVHKMLDETVGERTKVTGYRKSPKERRLKYSSKGESSVKSEEVDE